MSLPVRAAAIPATSLAVVLLSVALALSSGCPSTVGTPGSSDCGDTDACADGLVCQDAHCVARCTAGSCATGFCDVDTGACVDCADDGDCSDGLVCNRFTQRCVPQGAGCVDDDDCESGHCDLQKGACVECRSDEDCGFGFACEASTSTCAAQQGCANDGDCDVGVCDTAAATCVECVVPAHCSSGQCDTVSHTCVAACIDNGDDDSVVALASGSQVQGTICPGDRDEYAITGVGTLDATLAADAGRLVLTLHDDAGLLLTTAVPGGPGLTLHAASLPRGTYHLRVHGVDDGADGDYALQATITAPATCVELDTEDNDTPASASALANDGSLASGAICNGDVDVWRLTAAQGDNVTVRVVAGEGSGTLALVVKDGAGATVAQGLPASFTATGAGSFFATVSTSSGDRAYSIKVESSSSPPVCTQRDTEPNNIDADARSVTPGSPAQGTICAGDVDRWRFGAANLDDVTVTLTGTGVTGRLLKADGTSVASGTTMTAANLTANTYIVVVEGTNGTIEGDYAVSVVLTPEPQPDACAEGGAEPDSIDQPRPLSVDGTALPGRICADESDFWVVTLPFRTTLSVRTRFVDADGDLDLRLKDAAGATITSSAGVTDQELIVRALDAGTYKIEVFGFLGALNTYTVEATLQGCSPDDGFEENNTLAQASPIGGGTTTAVRCPGDDDFFAIRLENGDALDAALVPTGGALTMTLLSNAGDVVATDTADGVNRRLQTSGLVAGRYVVRVTGDGTARTPYTLRPAITPANGRCVDDGAESNDNESTPFVLDAAGLADGSYALSSLVMCDGALSTDMFAIDLPASKQVSIGLTHDTAHDLDVELKEARGTSGLFRSIARGIGTTQNDRVSGVINAAGRYLVRVVEFGTQPAAGVPYALGFELGDPSGSCIDDRFDTWTSTDDGTLRTHKNDDDTDLDASDNILVAPTDLSPPEILAQLRICPGNADWFKVAVPAGKKLVVDVTYAHASGRDIDVRVYGPDDTNTPADADAQIDQLPCPTGQCTGTDGTEHFELTSTPGGTFFIEVFGFSNGENVYALDVKLQ